MGDDTATKTAIAIITASANQDYRSMTELVNEMALEDISRTIVSLAALAASYIEYTARALGVSKDEMLQKLGLENARFRQE